MKNGFFITFEGLEGSGKSTQIELLAQKLLQQNYPVVTTREPGGTAIGETIRAITHNPNNMELTPVAEAYLMAASRAQHVEMVIKPALSKGKIVLCDRFLDSSLAYQGAGRKLGIEEILLLNHLAMMNVLPALTIYLAIDPDSGQSRRSNTQKVDRLDLQSRDFYQRVHQGYEEIIAKTPARFLVIDAQKDSSTIAKEIERVVREKLNAF